MKDDVPEEHIGVFSVGKSQTKVAIERDMDNLSTAEEKEHARDLQKAMLKELTQWTSLKALKIRLRKGSPNIMDSRWVHKWKRYPHKVEAEIKSRLCIRGFKDLQQDGLATFSPTASRMGQRFINWIAAQRSDFILFSCDVGGAFLKGLTFKEVAELTGEPLRTVQLDLPANAVPVLRMIPGFEKFNPQLHTLEMERPGFGLKDAPRLWNLRLTQVMHRLDMKALISDNQIFCRWSDGEKKAQTHDFRRLQMACSTHVDDLKGAATEPVADSFMNILEQEFGKLTRQKHKFEHTGVLHEMKADGCVECTQDHYVKQLRLISLDKAKGDDEDLDSETQGLYWSLLGGLAWLTVTRADIAVHVGYLQRHTHDTQWRHVRALNTVVKWTRRRSCVIRYESVPSPWAVTSLPDSAFAAQEPDCLAIRAVIVMIINVNWTGQLENVVGVMEYFTRKQPRVCRSTFAAEISAIDDGVSSSIIIQALLHELIHGPCTATELAVMVDKGTLLIPLFVGTDNKGAFSALSAHEIKKPAEPHLLYLLRSLRDRIDIHSIWALAWIDTRDMLSDALTKGAISKKAILDVWRTSRWQRIGDKVALFSPKRAVNLLIRSTWETYESKR